MCVIFVVKNSLTDIDRWKRYKIANANALILVEEGIRISSPYICDDDRYSDLIVYIQRTRRGNF